MVSVNHGRRGPPRPGSSLVTPGPRPERPWRTPTEQAELARDRKEAEEARVARFKLLRDAAALEPTGLKLEERVRRGEPLGFWDRTALDRWREIRGCLQGG